MIFIIIYIQHADTRIDININVHNFSTNGFNSYDGHTFPDISADINNANEN